MSADFLRTRLRAGHVARLVAASALGAAGVVLLGPGPALAEPQPSIEPQRLALVAPVEAGDQEALPAPTVADTGTFFVEVRSFADPAATPPEAAWLRIEPAESDLAPGEGPTVAITVASDGGVEAQSDRTLVTAGTRDGELAVASTLEFAVAAAPAATLLGPVEPMLVGIGAGAVALVAVLVLLARRLQFDIGAMRRRRDVVAVAAGTAEPSRSVLLAAPPELERVADGIEPRTYEAEKVRPWLSEFSEATFERPSRPSIDHPALPLAQMPGHSPLQVPLPPPLQPSLPPPLVAEPVATVEPERPAPPSASRPRGRLEWLTAGSFALGASLAVWAAVATWMLATRPEVNSGAIDTRIAALEARLEAMTAQLPPASGTTAPLESVRQAPTAEAGAPPSETSTPPALVVDPTSAALEPETTPEPVETEVAEPTSEPTPLATSQAVLSEAPPEETAIADETYVVGPGGGPLDTAGQDLYDCHNFETWTQALAVREASGPGDPNLIDTDGNGLPCESLMEREQAG